jgi:MFS family permease
MNPKLKQFIWGAIIVNLAMTAGYMIAPIEVRFLQTLTDNTTLIGLTYATGTIFFSLLSIWLGRLSDKFGRNRFLIVGCGLGVLYPLLYASTVNIFEYMGVRFVWAFSAVATGPIFMSYLQDLLEGMRRKGWYMGMVYSMGAILGAGAQFLGGVLSDQYGFRTVYIAMSGVFLLTALISLKELGFKKKELKNDEYEPRHLFFSLHYVFKKPELLFYFIQNFAFSVNWGIKGMLWPLIIFAMAGKDAVTGSIFGTMGVVAFFLLLIIGKMVDKIGPFSSSIISMSILGITGLFLALTNNLYVFWVAAGMFAIGEAIYGPTQAVLLTDHVKSKFRGEIMGLDAMVDSMLNTASPFLAGILLVSFDPQTVLLFYVLLFWLALVGGRILYIIKIAPQRKFLFWKKY